MTLVNRTQATTRIYKHIVSINDFCFIRTVGPYQDQILHVLEISWENMRHNVFEPEKIFKLEVLYFEYWANQFNLRALENWELPKSVLHK